MLTCNDASALIVRTVDDAPLSGDQRATLRRHLRSCPRCRAEYETQHGVRRLLVLHIHDRLPEGFDERLSARLAQTSRPQPSGPMRGTTAPLAAPLAAQRWLRLIPLAATLALMVAGTSVRDVERRPAAAGGSGAATVSSVAPERSSVFTTIARPRPEETPQRHQSSPAPSADVARAPAPPVGEDAERHRAETGAIADYGGRAVSEPRERERTSVVRRMDDTDDADAAADAPEHATSASQRPGILPRAAPPFPRARPAMPAPPAVLPDRSIPPW